MRGACAARAREGSGGCISGGRWWGRRARARSTRAHRFCNGRAFVARRIARTPAPPAHTRLPVARVPHSRTLL